MSDQEMLALFAEGLEVDVSTLSRDTVIADVDDWNSLGWLTIMSLLDEQAGIQLSAEEIRSFRTAGEVMDALSTKLAVRGA
jgi:acyl carrier protein